MGSNLFGTLRFLTRQLLYFLCYSPLYLDRRCYLNERRSMEIMNVSYGWAFRCIFERIQIRELVETDVFWDAICDICLCTVI